MGLQRRKDIYKLCQKHKLIIIEDEPYYFLQMDPYGSRKPDKNTSLLDSLIPSFMSMDTDGRVLRLDSLSKVSLISLNLITDHCPWPPISMVIWFRPVNRAYNASSRINNPSPLRSLPIHRIRSPGATLVPRRVFRLVIVYPERIHAAERHRCKSYGGVFTEGSSFMEYSECGDVLLG